MGWFAIACFVGFIGYWRWRVHAERLSRTRQIPEHEARLTIAIRMAMLAAVIVAVWVLLYEHAASIGQVADIFGSGVSARFLLGLVLGAGAAYLLTESSTAASAGGLAGLPRDENATETNGSKGPGTGFVLTAGAAITFVALIAPHIDGWLSHVTNLKTPVLEFQLASTTTQKVRLADTVETFTNQQSLYLVSSYYTRIDQDIQFLERYDKSNSAIKSAIELRTVFRGLISPVSRCMQAAIENGLSIDSARAMIRPMADLLEQITLHPNEPDQPSGGRHTRFWAHVMELPEKIRPFLGREDAEKCVAIPVQYGSSNTSPPFFPKLEKYKTVPYLYIASALFMTFMGDDDIALKVMQDFYARTGPESVDFNLFYLIGELSFYQGKPGDLDQSYFGVLNAMRMKARKQIQIMRGHEVCNSESAILCRARIADLVATNLIVYYLAEDLARDSIYALPYRARLEEYANDLKRVLDVLALIESDAFYVGGNSDEFYKYVARNKYTFMDTYAYAMLVLESSKTNPDREKLKKLSSQFDAIVEHVEEDVKGRPPGHGEDRIFFRIDLSQLKTARAHRSAARALVGE